MKNKTILISILAGGLYAFIPILGAIFYSGSSGGDSGSFWVLMLPPFWPLLITFYLGNLIVYSFYKLINLGLSENTSFIISSLINIILWGFIGYFIGRIINNIRVRK